MTKINIQFSRFSAFYTPLIATMAGGFLTDEGLEYDWSKAANNDAALQNLADGTVDVAQSAVGVSLIQLARGDRPAAPPPFRPDQRTGRLLHRRPPRRSRFPMDAA